MLTVDTNMLQVQSLDSQVKNRVSAAIDMTKRYRSDGSYEQPEYLSASDSVMSVPSQELGQTYNSHGTSHSNLFPPSSAHYFLHAQYHPQFNQTKPPLHHPEYNGSFLTPPNLQAPPQQPGSHQQQLATNGRLPSPLEALKDFPAKDYQKDFPKDFTKDYPKDYPSPKPMTHHASDTVENNNHCNNQVNKVTEKICESKTDTVQEERNGRSASPDFTKPQNAELEDKPHKEQYLNSDIAPNQSQSLEQDSSQRKTPEVDERLREAPENCKNDRTPSPNHRSSGFSPDENEARRRIESFIADQKEQGQTRNDAYSPEEARSPRSRRDSFYSERNRFSSPHTEQNQDQSQDHEGSETGSSYRYGDNNHMRNSISSDEGSNSHFQPRDSYSGRSSSLSPVSSNGLPGSRSDSAPPTPNHYFSPGGPFPGFPHSSTPTHSPHKLPPGVSPDNKDLFFCHLCSYVGTSKYHFNAHMNSHFEHRCPHCDYTSRTEGRLKRHMKDFHSDNPPENFSGMKMIRQVSRPKVFKCKQCDYQTEVKVDFWDHSKIHIKDEKVLQCPKCPFVTEYKHHLEYHLRNHFGSKPFKCNKCNYACVNKSMLNSHMKSHTNVYQYRCADCTYATKYCHSLKLHLKKYNHKPATVLNADGSLPTDGSGDFELVSKRGPPRGPRSVKRDKSPPGLVLPHRTVPGPPPPPPPMNGGLMSPFWPMMAAAQFTNGLRAPPPLIPMSGMDPMALGLSADPSKMPLGLLPPGMMMPGSKSKCAICDFTADNQMQLTQHVFQVHATENQDLFNMYGIPADTIMEQAMRTAAETAQKVVNNRSFSGPSPSPKSTSSKSPSTPQQVPTPSWMKQESSEDDGMPVTPNPPTTSTPRARPNGEIPLDLTKPKSDFPFGPMSSMDFARVLKRPLSEVDNGDAESPPDADKLDDNAECSPTPRKRSRKGKAYKLDTICMKLQERYGPESPGAEDEDDYMSDYHSEHGESSHATPESEGAMQRQISHEGPLSNGQMSESHLSSHLSGQSEERSPEQGPESESGSPSERISPAGIDYKKIHDSLRELNNGYDEKPEDLESSKDAPENPEDLLIHSDNPEGDVAQALAIAQSKRRESSTSFTPGSNTINRRKMFLMRHNDQQAAEAAARGMTSPEAMLNNHSLPSPSPPPLPRIIAPRDEIVDEPPKGSVYECNRCAIMFRDCIMYTMHMGYHGYQDPFKCNMCGHQAKDRVEFFLHIARAAHA